jgi:23S rRNA (cytosine1962-C5)-methyltransferase
MIKALPYKLLDCGNREKLELFGEFKLVRPCPQAMWPKLRPEWWQQVDAIFVRTQEEKGYWQKLNPQLPNQWYVTSSNGLIWEIEPNEFGNVGVFTEHWLYADELLDFFPKSGKILNLFTYSGSNCVILAKNGFSITAVDSSRQAITTYNHNLQNNHISLVGQRFILEDAYKFVAREVRRRKQYDGIMIDAPSYGRGTKGEIFKIEDHLVKLLVESYKLLTPAGKMVLTLHSPRFTPKILEILVSQLFSTRTVTVSELVPICESGVGLPSGFLVKVS